jgi:hypothetical protein
MRYERAEELLSVAPELRVCDVAVQADPEVVDECAGRPTGSAAFTAALDLDTRSLLFA